VVVMAVVEAYMGLRGGDVGAGGAVAG